MLTFTPWISVRWTDNCVLGTGGWLVQQFDGVNQEISTNLPPLCPSWCVVILPISQGYLDQCVLAIVIWLHWVTKASLIFHFTTFPSPQSCCDFLNECLACGSVNLCWLKHHACQTFRDLVLHLNVYCSYCQNTDVNMHEKIRLLYDYIK